MNTEEPVVLCLTNTVAANFTANVLLAIGAKPAMVEDPEEAAEFAALADAILVNVGTVTREQAAAMRGAIRVANERKTPWVLDPVAYPLLTFRRTLVEEFVSLRPTLIRGNHAEIKALAGSVPNLSEICPYLETGLIDKIVDKSGVVEIAGGVPMLQKVTATGCAQGAICAAALGRGQTPQSACVYASKLMKCAGERAWARAKTPGAFTSALMDEVCHD